MKKKYIALSLAALLVQLGCAAGRFEVHKVDSTSQLEGFRYNLPKPYLLVTNMAVSLPASANPAAEVSTGTSPGSRKPPKEGGGTQVAAPEAPAPGSVVTMQLLWLPDPSQQYAVSVKGGRSGTFSGKIQLANGWMLTGVNEDFDAKTAETITAVSGLLTGLIKTAGGVQMLTVPVSSEHPVKPFLLLFAVNLQDKKLEAVDTSVVDEALKKAMP